MKDTSGQNKRIYGLDILRASAILFVIYSHAFFLIIDHVNEKMYNLLSLDGVTMFFVLSGFLIGGILIRTIEKSDFNIRELLNFWSRRWFRTLPNYFLMLLLLILISILTGKSIPDSILKYFLFLQNFANPHPGFFPEAWSLTVEEWFYLLIPFGLFISMRLGQKNREQTIMMWIICIILLVTGLRVYRALTLNIPDFDTWDLLQRKVVITRLDSIMYGFLGAWFSFYRPSQWEKHRKPLFIAGLILLFIPALVEFFHGKEGFFLNFLTLPMTSAATLLMLPMLSGLRSGKGRTYRFLTFVSVISYSMYLVNFSLIQLTIIPSLTPLFVKITHNHLMISLMRVSVYGSFTFLFAWLMYRFYEKPMMNLRDRLRWNSEKVR